MSACARDHAIIAIDLYNNQIHSLVGGGINGCRPDLSWDGKLRARMCNLLSTTRITSTPSSSSLPSHVQVRITSEVTVWTIGHSNRSVRYFTDLLGEHTIKTLVDVRSFPTSKVDHFKREQMEKWLPEHGISYIWLGKELGGYRRSGYQAHMKTELFGEGIEKLIEIATQKKVCIMCLESNPKYCHRRYISAHLERQGANVIHIRKKGQTSLLKF